jgi:hypothetical protein
MFIYAHDRAPSTDRTRQRESTILGSTAPENKHQELLEHALIFIRA